MFTDWTVSFRLNRSLKSDEKNWRLWRERQLEVEPDDRGALIAFNSIFVDFVDRRYRLRGNIGTPFIFVGVIFFSIAPLIAGFGFVEKNQNFSIFSFAAAALVGWSSAVFFTTKYLSREFFSYTYRPIRFNRRTRKVYVFREGGRILSMPWEEGFFHIGQGLRDKILLDLRCHVLDGETVKDTFAVGHYFADEKAIRQEWEFIRRYMEEGPESVKPRFIGLSVKPNWTNCYVWITSSMGLGSRTARIILFPLIAILVITRWLALKSSRHPHFPPEIEAECTVDPSDPHDLPQPEFIGEGYDSMSEAEAKAEMERLLRKR